MSTASDKFPLPASAYPIADGVIADEFRWYTRLFGPINDAYDEVATADTGWITPTLGNSWVTFGGTWPVPAYRKKRGIVYLRGLVKSGTNGSSANAIFQLPSGFRPKYDIISSAVANNAVARVDIDSSGNVFVFNYLLGGTNAAVSLSGIHFYAEQ